MAKEKRKLYGPERDAQKRKEHLTEAEIVALAEAEAASTQQDRRLMSPTAASLAADFERRQRIEREAYERYLAENANPNEQFMVYEVPPVVVPAAVLARRAERQAKYRRMAEEAIARSERLREMREASGLTQAQMAHLSRVPLDTIKDLENARQRGEEVTERAEIAYSTAARMASGQRAALEQAVAAATEAGGDTSQP